MAGLPWLAGSLQLEVYWFRIQPPREIRFTIRTLMMNKAASHESSATSQEAKD